MLFCQCIFHLVLYKKQLPLRAIQGFEYVYVLTIDKDFYLILKISHSDVGNLIFGAIRFSSISLLYR